MGADERAFSRLDLSFCRPVFVKWIKPLPNEGLADYALRLSSQIREEEPLIVGLSFGGVLAIEIAKRKPVRKVVLISSAKTDREIPFYYKWLRFVPLHRMITLNTLHAANQLVYRLMRVTHKEDKKVFSRMLRVTDADLLKWSIDQLARWKNTSFPPHTCHIHGTADLMLPYRFIKADHTVKGGQHLMLISRAEEISKLLRACLSDP